MFNDAITSVNPLFLIISINVFKDAVVTEGLELKLTEIEVVESF